jgi:hypothetical protein
MTDNISQMIRWNANFVRGLAQSVLDRAKVIRSTLEPYASELTTLAQSKAGKKQRPKKEMVQKAAAKKALKKVVKSSTRKTKRTHA